ncbi:MAG TPA: lysine--tRNA ligase [Acidimicrobiia bacterium]|nr:lysine--tRNA ligase [Acidimicrobiia bacterium]
MTDDPPDALVAGRLDRYRRLPPDHRPTRFDRTHLASEVHERYGDLEPGSVTDAEVAVAGRVMLRRSFGKLLFLTVSDVSGTIQLFIERQSLGDEAFAAAEEIDLGDWVGAIGLVMTTKKGELSVRPGEVTVLQKSLRPLPDKWHGLTDIEARSRRRYLDLIANPESRRIAVTRSAVISELRRQFEARGYVEVETPVLLPQATGATARPFRTHHNALDQDMYLRIATELYLKRLVVGGLEKVFEIGRIFRNEGIDATHNPEFTMLESYEALADFTDIMRLTEEVFAAVAEATVGSPSITYQGRSVDLTPPFRRVRLLDVVSEAVGEAVGFDHPDLARLARGHGVTVGDDWASGKIIFELFEAVGETTLWEPTFVTHYPTEVSPLAARNRDDPDVTDRFELFIAGSEYANAFTELTDPLDQRARFEAQAAARAAGDEEAHPVDEDYLTALEYGLPPTGGLGIGVDRLVMLLTDQSHIRDVILFPTMRAVHSEDGSRESEGSPEKEGSSS